MNGEEAVHFARVERFSAHSGGRRRLMRAREGNRAEREAHHHGAAGLEKIAPRDRRGKFHAARHNVPDARSTARRMRVCAPQRQRWPESACFA
jgi:hypothetical protein